MERTELVALVGRLLAADYASEEERDRLLTVLEKSVRDPNVSDLIFYPEREMTAEEIVDAALAYRPMQL
jgi:hypothetical protein